MNSGRSRFNALTVVCICILAVIAIIFNKWLVYPLIAMSIIFIFFALLITLISKLIKAFRIEQTDKGKRRYILSVMICTIFFYIVSWYANRYVLPGMFQVKSLIGDVGIIMLALFLGLSVLKTSAKTISVTVLFALLLSAFIFIDIESEEGSDSRLATHLKSLPYLSYVKEGKAVVKDGVTVYKKDKVQEGINLYNSWELPGAYILDMSGNVLHEWSLENTSQEWQYVKLLHNGDLLLIIKDVMLTQIDWNSEIKWVTEGNFHHEIQIMENRDILTLSGGERWIFHYGLPIPIRDDYLTIVSEKGEVTKKISFYELVKDKIPSGILLDLLARTASPEQLLETIKRTWQGKNVVADNTIFDVLHVNTLEIIDRDFDDVFKKGNVIFSVAMLDLIGVIDMISEEAVWTWGQGTLELPHHPTLKENGNILVYDNGIQRGFSRIIEVNTSTQEIVWEYTENPPEYFFTSWGGANQILPNGNILVTVSANARVLELSGKGEIVWEFYNPVRDAMGRRGTIYRMTRIIDIEDYNFLKKLKTVPF